ncbi:MAG: hypothetical protein LBR22_00790 [Desulfovibrio sp.]|jgi:uncharacterized protein YecT (DUF1311 family)|nr:hypothetical protein [Desulfovibrio sp.]
MKGVFFLAMALAIALASTSTRAEDLFKSSTEKIAAIDRKLLACQDRAGEQTEAYLKCNADASRDMDALLGRLQARLLSTGKGEQDFVARQTREHKAWLALREATVNFEFEAAGGEGDVAKITAADEYYQFTKTRTEDVLDRIMDSGR